jgi:beta-glucosidase
MKKYIFITLTVLVSLQILTNCRNHYQFAFQNPQRPVKVRVNDLISHMTLEEKIGQMIDAAPAIPRLGIPEYNWWSEGLHGVANAGIATVFPQAIGLGATFDTALVYDVADVVSTEFRAKHNEFIMNNDHGRFKGLTVWSPNINIFRDPRWGRGQETYGEDPYLTSRIGVSFVKGLQGNDLKYLKVISTPKHYAVHSGPEPERHRFNAITSRRDFLETYSPAFEALIREGGAWSIMGAYNRYMDDPCCASPFLLREELRGKWGFKGYVVSDCGAIDDIWQNHKVVKTAAEAAALAVKAGCDLNCGDTYLSLKDAVEKKLITEKEIDVSLKRLFEARFRLGMFDPDKMVKYAQIPISQNDTPEHRKLALKAAHESIVLLKNENNTLPVRKDIKTIVVIGPNANSEPVLYGNYNGVSSHAVTPLEGIRNKIGSSAKVIYIQGCNIADDSPAVRDFTGDMLSFNGQPGLQGEYFNNMKLEGKPVLTRIDKNPDFNWNGAPPAAGVNDIDFSVRWTGKLTVHSTGKYYIAVTADDGYRLFMDNKLVFELWKDQAPIKTGAIMDLKAGESHDIKIEYYQNKGGSSFALQWGLKEKDYLKKTVDAVSGADIVIFFGGISSDFEGEEMAVNSPGFLGGDRTSLDLPEIQEKVLKALKETGKTVILVLMSGSALSINWETANLPAIIQSWYPGEEGGNAIADVLFGDYNPSGRLPVTFYKSVSQLPPFEEYAMKGRTYKYFEGEPLYPFGFGLSFTSFAYSNLNVPQNTETDKPVAVSVDVQNTGKTEGDEVIQVYISHKNASVPVPIRSLVAFRRVHLDAGEKMTLEFKISSRQLSVITDKGKRQVEPGSFEITAGGCQSVNPKPVSTGLVSGSFNLTGNIFELKE